MTSRAASTYYDGNESRGGVGSGFVPSGPPGQGSAQQRNQHGEPVIPSPMHGPSSLNQQWHPGGQQYLQSQQQSEWMGFGDPNRPTRPGVYPQAQPQAWAPGHSYQRSQDRLGAEAMYTYGSGMPWGGTPMQGPMVMGPSPYMNPQHLPAGMPHMTTPYSGMMHPQMLASATPGMYPSHMMGGGMTSPGDMGLPRNLAEPDTLPHFRSSRPNASRKDEGVFVDKWAEGKNYGPVLNTRLLKILKIEPEINPLLHPSLRHEGAYLEWNMLFPDSSIHLSSEPSQQSWRAGRDAPAILPRSNSVTIISPHFGFVHTIKTRRPTDFISCGYLIHNIYRFLHTLIQEDEYEEMTSQRKGEIYTAYQTNRGRGDRNVPGGSMPREMVKIDMLCNNVMFEGITQDPELAYERMGFEIPDGGDPCVLVLLCGPRAVAGLGTPSPASRMRGLPRGSPSGSEPPSLV